MVTQLFYLKDILEILFFGGIVYAFSVWLSKDKKNNLLLYFYLYCALCISSTLFHLPTVTAFLLYSSPIVLILFIIFHQEVLQRNFITLQHTNAAESSDDETAQWLENLVRASLHAINNNKQLLCVIEHQSDLKPFLNTVLTFNSPLQQNMLTLLIDSNGFDHHKMIWCTSKGKLVGINASWHIQNSDTWHSTTIKELPGWQQDALLMSLKTDIIIFKADPVKRAFDLVMKGVLHETISAHHILPLIKKQLSYKSTHKGEIINEYANQKHAAEQQNN